MTYWLDLFNGTTWKEFRDAGASLCGFRTNRQATALQVQPGDILLCYVTGVMRWVGALEVIGPSQDPRPIFSSEEFPVRFQVRPLVLLDPECGLPMEQLQGQTAFFAGPEDAGRFKGFVRTTLTRFERQEDGDRLLSLLREAEAKPVLRPVDPRKLTRQPYFKTEMRIEDRTVEALVTVPEEPAPSIQEEAQGGTRHTEIQHHLLALGADMGLDVWVARNDRSRTWDGRALGSLPRTVDRLPAQFNEATQRTIELIDVLWLKSNAIVAAFEVECTTSVYSGLLRMSDLLALQPNLAIDLYLVAPDERRDKVRQEILRPTFKRLNRPLASVCGFLGFSDFVEKVEGIRRLDLAASLSPDFLKGTAEYFGAGME